MTSAIESNTQSYRHVPVDRKSVFWNAASSVTDAQGLVARSPKGSVGTAVRAGGLRLTPMTAGQVVNEIVLRSLTEDRLLIANHNLHSLYLWQRDAEVRAFYDLAEAVIIDGAPILWLAQNRCGSLNSDHRVGSTDWLVRLLPVAAEAGLRIAFLGGAPGVGQRAADEIAAHHPTLEFHVHDGYFDRHEGSEENEAVLAWLEDVKPDVLMVGMGMPVQEAWIARNYDRLSATVVCTVGGCIDYVAGEQELAPRWMGRVGMEWAYRLARDPGRLWRRYMLEPPAVAAALARRRIRRARAPRRSVGAARRL
jgi:N-acetylglucosaminyldiphosphoundecaprenol N-acetyl-beta-D-mannosaminyltransferase